MTGRESLRWSAALVRDGLRVELGAYRSMVLVDLEELVDQPGRPVAKLAAELGDGWIPSVDEALSGITLRPIHDEIRRRVAAAVDLVRGVAVGESTGRPRVAASAPTPAGGTVSPPPLADVAAEIVGTLDGEAFDELRLRPIVVDALRTAGFDGPDAERGADIVRGLVVADHALRGLDDEAVAAWFGDPTMSRVLYVHDAGGVRWFDRDAFELTGATIDRLGPARTARDGAAGSRIAELARSASDAGYRVDELLARLGRRRRAPDPSRRGPRHRTSEPAPLADDPRAGRVRRRN